MNDTKFYKMDAGAKVHDGILLSRIVATDGCIHAKPGTIGGWIESEDNLSGNAWVADNAMVYGNAKVFGNAIVYENAIVRGNAEVGGNAEIDGSAIIHERAKISGSATVSGSAVVGGNSRLRKDANVHGYAMIGGHAAITGNASVCGQAIVEDYAVVDDVAEVSGKAHVRDHVTIGGNANVGDNCVLMGSAVIKTCRDYDLFRYNGTEDTKTLTFTASDKRWSMVGFYGDSAQLLDYARNYGRNFYDYCFNIVCAVMAMRNNYNLVNINDYKKEGENNESR